MAQYSSLKCVHVSRLHSLTQTYADSSIVYFQKEVKKSENVFNKEDI